MNKYLTLAAIALILAGVGLWAYRANASDTGTTYPTTNASISINNGSADSFYTWTNAGNIYAQDNTYATASGGIVASGSYWGDYSGVDTARVYVLKAGSTSGTPWSDYENWPASNEVAVYGGPTSLWGTTWTAAEINASGFGAGIAATDSKFDSPPSFLISGKGYGFAIPGGATIDGIEVRIGKYADATYAYVDSISITVYYTGGSVTESATQVMIGSAF